MRWDGWERIGCGSGSPPGSGGGLVGRWLRGRRCVGGVCGHVGYPFSTVPCSFFLRGNTQNQYAIFKFFCLCMALLLIINEMHI